MADAKIDRIKNISLFSKCDKAHLKHVAEIADETTVSPGHKLTEQGHYTSFLYIVESGKADVVMDGEVIGTADPGEAIGDVSMFDQGPASATVTVTEQMNVLAIPHSAFMDIVEENPTLAIGLLHEMAVRIREVSAHL